jgi:hypothetical protein
VIVALQAKALSFKSMIHHVPFSCLGDGGIAVSLGHDNEQTSY